MKQIISVIVVITVLSGSQVLADPIDYNGYVSADSLTAHPGDQIGIQVWLRDNDVNISAMTIPLKWNSTYLQFDSVSMAGTVWNGDFAHYARYIADSQIVQLTILPDDIVSPIPYVVFTNGVVAELFFTLASDAPSQFIDIDSVFSDDIQQDGTHIMTRIDISDNIGEVLYHPGYVPGGVEVLVPTGINEQTNLGSLPGEYELAQNYPNPFNPVTTIGFSLPEPSEVSLYVYNILGQEVANPVNGYMEAGIHELEFDASRLPSGIYFYRLIHEEGTLTRKMVLLK